ncbi:hypothetical protein KI387_038947 [Taxus chinensis]|uniref:DUF7903 domain-containing protein n=1 Tax=Taxus chinensis TaxID=29808 RepID=A0AA38F7H7_TAXCH|nr:hypothetical protein KI387_038947 [Taxus chinensis]
MVKDTLDSDAHLRLTCRKKGTDGKQLELKKIELGPFGYVVADISCLNKLIDLRLIVLTEVYLKLTELREEIKECIEGIVKSACIEESAKGGLHWPLGDSARNSFKVVTSMHYNVTTIVAESWNVKFQRANRAEFETSSGRVTNEVNVKLKKITKHLRDQRPWEEDKIMNILEDILKWFWTEL